MPGLHACKEMHLPLQINMTYVTRCIWLLVCRYARTHLVEVDQEKLGGIPELVGEVARSHNSL